MLELTHEITNTSPDKLEIDAIYVHLAITDPDVASAMKEHEQGNDRNKFIELALKVGVLSLRAAKGVVDGEQIKASGEKLISQLSERLQGHRELIDQTLEGTLRQYFDPNSGQFSSRVSALTSDDGELAQLVRRQISTQSDKLGLLLEGYIGADGELSKLLSPGEGNAFMSQMQAKLQSTLCAERDAMLSQFSLDSDASALSRLVKELRQNHGDVTLALTSRMQDVIGEFSLDKPDSALSRLVGRVEVAQKAITDEFTLDRPESALRRLKAELIGSIDVGQKSQESFQSSVLQILSALQSQKKAEARSTTHGIAFESNVGYLIEEIAMKQGDVFSATGSTTGHIKNCKVGDFTITMGPDSAAAGSSIVCEAKEDASYNLKSTLAEADEARRNRGAGVCVFVHSRLTAPGGLESLSRFGNDVICVWDAEDATTNVTLRAAFMAAKAMSVRRASQSSKEATNWVAIDKGIEAARKQIAYFIDLKTSTETISRAADKSLERIRLMQKNLEESLELIEENLCGMRVDNS